MSKEPSEQRGLVSLTPSPRNMPPDWRPPAPAWAASFSQQTTPVVMAYFGTQFESDDSEQRAHRVDEFLNRADAPDNVESARFFDRAGRRNLITSAYWIDPARYERWKDKWGFEAWGNAPPLIGYRQGHFREILTVPRDRFETLFSHISVVGVAKAGGPVVGPIREHNYW